MNNFDPRAYLNGRTDEPTPPFELTAGPLKMSFDPEIAFLRQIRLGDHEALRAIYPAVRDRTWRTIPLTLSDLNVESTNESFVITFSATHLSEDVDFRWSGRIEGSADGSVSYRFDGAPNSPFERMRIGLLALIPSEHAAGTPVTIEHGDGSLTDSQLPNAIAPDEPSTDIRAIRREVAPGVIAETRFEGEAFEMEDQRNWTDASYKIYSTPAALPRPVPVGPNDRVRQSIALRFPETPRKILPILIGREPQFNVATTPVYAIPPLGLIAPTHPGAPTELEIDRLKALELRILRINVDLSSENAFARLERDLDISRRLGLRIHLAIFDADNRAASAEDLVEAIALEDRGAVSAILALKKETRHTPEETLEYLRDALASAFPKAVFAAGSRDNFVEVNRNRSLAATQAIPLYAVTPIVHAFDDLTCVENLMAQTPTLKTLSEFWPQSPIISPLGIARNRYPIDAEDPDAIERSGVDHRQASLFNAGWTLGALAKWIVGGPPHSLTICETSGARGVMESAETSPSFRPFPSIPGSVYPIYHLLADFAGFVKAYSTLSSHPWVTSAITLVSSDKKRRILVANHTGADQSIRIKTGPASGTVRILDGSTVIKAMSQPEEFRSMAGEAVTARATKVHLNLAPYAIATVDLDR